MHYNPIGFLQKDLIYEEKGACISQMLEATTMLNGIEYEVGIFEIIDIPSYKGNISISSTMKQKQGRTIMILLYLLILNSMTMRMQ